MLSRVFCNHNGKNYCILEGEIGKPALLANLNEKQFVIAAMLNDTHWYCGRYFTNLKDAYEEWSEKYV